MLKFFRRKAAPADVLPARADLRIRNLLDDPALRRAMGLDGAEAPSMEAPADQPVRPLRLGDVGHRVTEHPRRRLVVHTPPSCHRRRVVELVFDDAAA